jgi:hypothetical protein
MTTALFSVHHTIHLSRVEVLEALRNAALAQARESLRLTDPAVRGVELETRLLSGSMVEIDGAAIAIEGGLPDDLATLLRTTTPAPAAATPLATPAATPSAATLPAPGSAIAEMMAEVLAAG